MWQMYIYKKKNITKFILDISHHFQIEKGLDCSSRRTFLNQNNQQLINLNGALTNSFSIFINKYTENIQFLLHATHKAQNQNCTSKHLLVFHNSTQGIMQLWILVVQKEDCITMHLKVLKFKKITSIKQYFGNKMLYQKTKYCLFYIQIISCI